MTWAERSDAVIAQGCLTYSKHRTQFIEGVYPTHIEIDASDMVMGGEPCECHPHSIYAGGKWNVDFVCGLGANLIDIRNSFSLPTIQEVVLAERIKALFPCIDKLRILKTGSAACDAAVRIARAATGRFGVLGVGYHGCGNTFISAEDPGAGTVPEGYKKLPSLGALVDVLQRYHESLTAFNRWVGAVIIEPVQLDMSVRSKLEEIRKLCTKKKIVLIFDEIISGFRVPGYSFSNYWGIQPDLICLGKALGSGHAVSVVGGKEEIISAAPWFLSNTHNGELSAINAALDTLNFLTPERIEALWNRGAWFQKAFNAMSPKLQIVGYPSRGELQGEEMFKALFMQEACKAGMFFGRCWFITHAHTEEVLRVCLDKSREIVARIEAGNVVLEGKLPKPVFKRN